MRTFLLAMAALLPLPAAAATILGNTPDSNTSHYAGNLVAVANQQQWVAIGWTMGSSSYTFSEIDVLLYTVGFAPCNSCAFSGRLWSNNGGVPGTELAVLTPSLTDFKSTPNGVPISFTSPSTITLAANTSYWLLMTPRYPTFLVLAGATPLSGPGATYLGVREGFSPTGQPIGQNPTAADLSSPGIQPYFVLSGETAAAPPVPEPGTWLVGAGLAMLAGLRVRRTRTS